MTRRGLATAAALAVGIAVALEVALPDAHGPGWTSQPYHLPGFSVVMGVLGAALLNRVAKLLGDGWLRRPAGYYGEPDLAAADEPEDPRPRGDHD